MLWRKAVYPIGSHGWIDAHTIVDLAIFHEVESLFGPHGFLGFGIIGGNGSVIYAMDSAVMAHIEVL